MKTLVVGNSLDVLSIIENVLSQNKEEQVVLFATEGVLPYEHSNLPALAAGTITEQVLYKTAEIFLAAYHPQVITGEVLARVSVQRKYLTTEKKIQIDYDKLVVADTGNLILPPVKGHQRTGVFDCWRVFSVKAMMKYLGLSDNVTLAVSNIQGFNMACALSSLKKEVTVVCTKPGLLTDIFDEETGLLLKQILEGRGVRVFGENTIEEILGDAEVKAVKLQSGKVLASDAVIFDEVQADTRMFSQPVELFQSPALPLGPVHFGINVLKGFYAGCTKMPEGGREYLKFDGPQNIYKKIYVQGDHIAGLVVFNAPEDQERLWGMFQRKENVAGHEEEIL